MRVASNPTRKRLIHNRPRLYGRQEREPMGPRNSHYRQRTKTLGADVPHSQVAKLAENPVAHRHALGRGAGNRRPRHFAELRAGLAAMLISAAMPAELRVFNRPKSVERNAAHAANRRVGGQAA